MEVGGGYGDRGRVGWFLFLSDGDDEVDPGPHAKKNTAVFDGQLFWPTAYAVWVLVLAAIVFPVFGFLRGSIGIWILIGLESIPFCFAVNWKRITNACISPGYRIATGCLAATFIGGLSCTAVVLSASEPALLEVLPAIPGMLLLTLLFLTVSISGRPFRFVAKSVKGERH